MISLAGCQAKLKHEVSGKVEPVEIKHYVALDTDKLESYYRSECSKTYTLSSDVEKCTDEELGKFLDKFTHSV